jgi:hypothetical protein
MKNSVLRLVLALTSALLVSACAAPANVPPPTAAPTVAAVAQATATAESPTGTVTTAPPTNVPPTATEALPTATNTSLAPTATITAVPPTATNAPVPEDTATVAPTVTAPTVAAESPTATLAEQTEGVADIIGLASIKNQNLTSYRGDSVQRVDDGEPGIWKGEVRVPDVHYTYVEGDEQREIITVGNDFYLKNNESPDADEWFLIPEAEHDTFNIQAPRPTIAQFSGFFGDFSDAQTAILNSYRKTETVSMDGQQCDVYAMDKPAVGATFFNLWTQKNILVPPSEEMGALFDEGEIKVWLCEDGYLHQLQVMLKPAADFAAGLGFKQLEATAHIYDLDADVRITAPTNVKPFPTTTP